MCKCKCDTPEEGVLLEEDIIAVPVSYYEELIRAQTERDILEATIEGENRYSIEQVLQGIKDARKNRLRCMCISEEENRCEPAPVTDPAEDVNEDA